MSNEKVSLLERKRELDKSMEELEKEQTRVTDPVIESDYKQLEFNELTPGQVSQHIGDVFFIELCARCSYDFFDISEEDMKAINERSHQRMNMYLDLVRTFKR